MVSVSDKRFAARISLPFESRVYAFEQDPISNLLCAATVSQTSHLGEVASADSDRAELFEIGMPL